MFATEWTFKAIAEKVSQWVFSFACFKRALVFGIYNSRLDYSAISNKSGEKEPQSMTGGDQNKLLISGS